MRERPRALSFRPERFQGSMRELQQGFKEGLGVLPPEERKDFEAEIEAIFTACIDRLNQEPEIEEKLLTELAKARDVVAGLGVIGGSVMSAVGFVKKDVELVNRGVNLVIGSNITLILLEIAAGAVRRARRRVLERDYKEVITHQLVPAINSVFQNYELGYCLIAERSPEGLKYLLLPTEEAVLDERGNWTNLG